MQAKDVALLGFVSSAQEYVQKHMNDAAKLGDLKQINIDRLKGELLAQLKFFAGKEDINDLIAAGNAAFEEFKNEKLVEKKTNSVIDQLGEIFDVDFDDDIIDDEDVAAEKINDLLKAYDTDDTKEVVTPIKKIEEPIQKEIKPEVFNPKVCIDKFIKNTSESVKLPQVSIDKFIKAHAVHAVNTKKTTEQVGAVLTKLKEETLPTISIDQFIIRYKEPEVTIDEFIERYREAFEEDKENAVTIDEFINKYKEIEKTLVNDAKVSIDEFIQKEETSDDVLPYVGEENNFGLEEDDEFLKAIASAASKNNQEVNAQQLKEEIKAPVHPKNMDELYSDVVNNEPLSSRLSSYRQSDKMDNKEFEKKKEEIFTNAVQAAVKASEKGAVLHLSDELKNYARPVQEKVIEQPTASDYVYIENPGLSILEQREKNEAPVIHNDGKISSAISNLKNKEAEAAIEEIVNEENEESSVVSNYDASNALADLKDFAKSKLNEKKKEEFDPNSDIYNNIAMMYEHLNLEFIKSAYALKSELGSTLKEKQPIVLLHRIRFSSIERLRSFVEITISHDYAVNVDEKQMIVDVFKDYINTEGLVLGTIYTIANQAALLDGEYEGYRIIEPEGK